MVRPNIARIWGYQPFFSGFLAFLTDIGSKYYFFAMNDCESGELIAQLGNFRSFNPHFRACSYGRKQRQAFQYINGKVQSWGVPIIEGAYLQGLNKGIWTSYTAMFKYLRDFGATYTLQSYQLFRRGVYAYIPNEVISLLLYLTGLNIFEAYLLGLDNAEAIFKKYCESY